MRFILVFLLTFGVAACSDPTFAPLQPEAAQFGAQQRVVVVTNRAREPSGYFGGQRSYSNSYLDVGVSIPAERQMGSIPVSARNPVPGKHFVLTDNRPLEGRRGFRKDLSKKLAQLPPADRDITIFVHGYNNSYSDGIFRAAQLFHDFELKGLSLHFSWPSIAHPLGYSHDRDSLLFARDALENMLEDVARVGAKNVVLVGHSLGSMLVMETLRQMDIRAPGRPDSILNGVVLVSPDIDVELFEAQSRRIKSLPQPFAIFVSQRDRALQLSSRINGRSERLGQLKEAKEVADLDVTVFDVTAFADRAMDSHFTAGSSPALISILSRGAVLGESFASQNGQLRGGLPGVALTVRNATQVILSPGLFNL
ncbi:alpha/beta hydrolase [Pseudooceanicola sp.]|uniref:alpha/beta hydrolase n=1 Tax=Pseudooceanicola sp. TaxID=1914328 RepID=UPI0035C73399